MVKATVFIGILLLCLLYISLNLKRKEETQQLESLESFMKGVRRSQVTTRNIAEPMD